MPRPAKRTKNGELTDAQKRAEWQKTLEQYPTLTPQEVRELLGMPSHHYSTKIKKVEDL